MVLALQSSEALELRKWSVLGQIDGNHTSSQLALSHGGEGDGWTEGGEVAAGGWVLYAGSLWEQKNA